VAVKIASALVLNKILAIYVGPSGYAVIGQFQNAVSIITSLAGGVITTGVTQATAEHFDNEAKQHTLWQTAIRLSLLATIASVIPLLLLRSNLAQWLLHASDMTSVFIWLALALPAMVANNLLLAIANGKKEVGIYVTSNLLGSFFSLIVTGFLAFNFSLYGALVAYAINPAIVLMATTTLIVRSGWFKPKFLWGKLNRLAVQKLSGFALMGITTALTVPVSYMFIRNHLATNLGLPAAGYWQASWKISEIYLMLVTTTLSVYYLPRIAEIRTAHELRAEIIKVYRFVMPIVSVGAVTIYFLRDLIIATLFAPDFLPMRGLFPWQLTGDVIKIGSWVLGYILIGRSLIKLFVATELAFSVLFVGLSWALINGLGLIGATIAYAVSYGLYFICMALLVTNELQKMERKIENF
jgi:PST family polysaccharide transporter